MDGYSFTRATLGRMFLTLSKYKIEGIENLPDSGRFILAGNHTGCLDPFTVQMAMVEKHLWFITGIEAFHTPFWRRLLKYYKIIPLLPHKEFEAIDAAVEKLENNEPVIIFPEGKFSEGGKISEFKRGVAIIAKKAQAPIVPFAIHGGYEAWSGQRKFPKLFTPITIRFGQAIEIGEIGEACEDCDENEKALTKYLQDRVQFMKTSLEIGDLYKPSQTLSLKIRGDGDGYEEMNFEQISRQAHSFAKHLTAGERVAILSESRPEFAVAMFAIMHAGAIAVVLNAKLTPTELTAILQDCKPDTLCCSRDYLKTANQLKEQSEWDMALFVLEEIKEFATGPEAAEYPKVLDDTAIISYTSGTTGGSKGVMISYGNVYAQLKDFKTLFKISGKHTVISILPLCHLFELVIGFFCVLNMGANIIYLKNQRELANVMKEKKITNMIVVPTFIEIIKKRLKAKRFLLKPLGTKFEFFICGGAPLDIETAKFFEQIKIPVYQGYGLTEASPVVSTNYPKNNKLGTVGKVLPSFQIKLARDGEILIKGPGVMKGYYKQPELTAQAIDKDGWLHTGDIGEIDKQGYLKITGRIKNMIVLRGGENVSPEEVEAVIEKSPLIKEVCVLLLDGKISAIAVTDNAEDDVKAEIKKLCKEKLASYKQPVVIIIRRDELPKTSTEKIKRNEVLKLYSKPDLS